MTWLISWTCTPKGKSIFKLESPRTNSKLSTPVSNILKVQEALVTTKSGSTSAPVQMNWFGSPRITKLQFIKLQLAK